MQPCNHEEADNRLFLHTKDISNKCIKKAIIVTVDIESGSDNYKLNERGYLSLEEVLNAVLESSENSSDDECNNGNRSLE